MIDQNLFKQALLIRRVEERLFDLFSDGKVSGTIHACVGQEFSALAFSKQLKSRDVVFSGHRCHGHFIAHTQNHAGLIAELLGKKTGVCGGVGSSQHLFSDNFFSNGVQGGITPVAAGVALAKQLKKSEDIVLVYIGDGTLGEGVVYEAMNLASLWRLPLLIVCEDNGYAQSTPKHLNLAGSILKRAEAFGIKTFESDIWDLENFFTAAKTSVDYVRQQHSPVFHLVNTYRLYPHSKNDDARDSEAIKTFAAKDPLNVWGRANPATYNQYLAEVNSEVDNVIEKHLFEKELSLDAYWSPVASLEHRDFEAIQAIDVRQVDLINKFFHEAMEKNPSVLFMGEDVLSPYGGAFKVAKGLSEKYPGRVLTTSISEAAITGIANGLALAGFRPFLEIMFGDFMTLCMDQIINHASKFYHMYNKGIKCPVVIRTPMGGRRGYGPTHSQSLDKFLVGIDNVTTVALNSLVDPGVIYKTILDKEEHPVIVIENKTDYGKKIAQKRISHYKYEKTRGDYPVVRIMPLRSDPNVTFVTYGGMVDIVLDAIEPLFLELDLKPEILVLSKIHPIRYREILDSVKMTKRLFVVEEGSAFGGIGSEIISSVVEAMEDKIIARRIASLPVPIPSAPSLENSVLPSVKMIIDKIKESL